MNKIIEQSFFMNVFTSEVVEDALFVLCDFRNARFGNAKFNNCIFSDCQFNLALFEDSEFNNCTFKACELINADFEDSKFSNCYAYLSTFISANFSNSEFGFISTDMCSFSNSRFGKDCKLPASCREIVGEVISQISSDSNILAFSGLIKTYQEFCWETLIKIGRSFLSKDDAEKVINGLKRFDGFERIINKFSNNKKLLEA